MYASVCVCVSVYIYIYIYIYIERERERACIYASQVTLVVMNQPAKAGDARDRVLIAGLGRFPGVGNGTPLQYSCLENSKGRGAWWV